jgi:FlaA1/EpsC-like NDP-sugar epimerase
MYKFRTMIAEADQSGPALTYKNDPRITRIGRFLRRTRLDELPQFINVLKGDMSLVGPRPEAPEYVDTKDPLWRQVLSVQPGICGLAQLTYAFDEATILTNRITVDRDYLDRVLPTKLALDLEYIHNCSLMLDLSLLMQTFFALLRRNVVVAHPQLQVALADRGGKHYPSPATRLASIVSAIDMKLSPRFNAGRTLIWNTLLLAVLDIASVVISFWVALAFRFDGDISALDSHLLITALPIVIFTYVLTNYFFGLYHYLWRYTSASEVLTIAIAAATSTVCLLLYSLLWVTQRPVPLSVVGLGGIVSGGLFTAVRYRQRLLTGLMGRLQRVVGSPDRERMLIIGAGEAGQRLAQQIKMGSENQSYELVGFVDDDSQKRGMRVHGAQVLGDRHAIPEIVAQRGVSLIILAIHKIPGPTLRDILSICLTTQTRVKILPDFLGTMQQSNGVPPLRDINPEDLLGRQLCEVDQAACREIIAGRVVLVTGAAGSIGSELCRQILSLEPRLLLLLDNNETGLHDLFISLKGAEPQQVQSIIADITNKPALEAIFAKYLPQIVFHAAAYKHVPMMELHPDEAIRVNVVGMAHVAELSSSYQVERFVFISTDKAINPSSIMGATKRLGELIVMNTDRQTSLAVREVGRAASEEPTVAPSAELRRSLFTAVRFGNVLGSRGSVVPTFARQIEQGGPVTITHEDMTRYFISLSEAVSLTIQAATLTEGGDIFMLDMGQAIRIKDLAYKMIRLRGLRPEEDIPVVYSGMRSGEKLHEDLLGSDETRWLTAHPKIFQIWSSHSITSAEITSRLSKLAQLVSEQRTHELVDELWQLLRRQPVSAEGLRDIELLSERAA